MANAPTDSPSPPLSSPPRFFERLLRIVEKRPGQSGQQIQHAAHVAPKAVFEAIAYGIGNGLLERRPVAYRNAAEKERVRDGLFLVGDRRSGPEGGRRRGPDPKIMAARTRRLAELCLPALLERLDAQDGPAAWQLREDPALAAYGADIDKAIALALERRLIYAAPTFYITAGNQHRTRTGFYLGAGAADPPPERLEGADLKKTRFALHRSRAQLAEDLGISTMLLVSWELRWVPLARSEQVRRQLDAMTPLPLPEEHVTALVETLVRITEAKGGLSRDALISRLRHAARPPAVARPAAGKLASRAFDVALGHKRVHERHDPYFNAAGIARTRCGIYPGPPDAEARSARLTGTSLKEELERLRWTRAGLAARVGVTEGGVAYWLKYGVPPARAPAVRLALELEKSHPGGPRKGAEGRVPEVLAAIAKHRGLTRSELSRQFFRDSRWARAAIRLAIESDQAHERPARRPRGRSHMTVLAVHPGPAPATKDAAAALRTTRRAAGMTQAQLGQSFEQERTAAVVSSWETGRQPIPLDVRTRLRQLSPELAAALDEMPLAPQPPPEISAADLQRRRLRAKMSQAELGRRLDPPASASLISAWERERVPVPAHRREPLREVLSDPRPDLSPAVLTLIREEPGISSADIHTRLDWAAAVSEAICALLEQGEVYERPTERRYADGRRPRWPALHPAPDPSHLGHEAAERPAPPS